MRQKLASIFVLLSLGLTVVPISANAADPQVMKQLSSLKSQVRILQQELAALKSTIQVSKGTMTVTVQQQKQESIGSDERIQVGGNQHSRIGRTRSETVGQNDNSMIGGDQSVTVGKNSNLNAKRNVDQNAGLNYSVSTGKRLTLTAGEEIVLKAGKASLTMKKNGNISITGKDIQIKGSGDVLVKGNKRNKSLPRLQNPNLRKR